MTTSNAFKTQIGGTHYSDFVIQPTEYISKNKFDWYEANMIKYTSRHKLKGGATDILKVIHYAQMLLEDTYGIVLNVNQVVEKEKTTRQKRKKKKVKVVPNDGPAPTNSES